MSKKVAFFVCFIILVAAGGVAWAFNRNSPTAPSTKSSTQTKQKTQQSSTKAAAFDTQKYSLTDPTSPWVIVNKQHPLQPVTYTPSDLRIPNVPLRVAGATEMQMRDAAATALESLVAAAKDQGIGLKISTAYRGYNYQKTLYDGYVTDHGQAAADTFSARPGYSEHQTGWAVDLRDSDDNCGLEQCFGETTAGKWLATNAYKYGFLLRYPQDKEAVTGYEYEPWHFRYIGTELSNELHTKHIETLEEFFDVSGGTTYQ